MLNCSKCGGSNPNTAKFCNECGNILQPTDSLLPPKQPDIFATQIQASQNLQDKIPASTPPLRPRSADIMFVLDCTGSMQGEINAIKDSITNFTDSITTNGVRVRVGLIAFRDRLIGETQRVLTFNGEVFTAQPALFRQEVSQLSAAGGGDDPESSLDAVLLATQQPFSIDTNHVIVLITDAPPHLPDLEVQNITQVINALNQAKISQFYWLGRTTQAICKNSYLPLMQGRQGMAFELGQGEEFLSRAAHFHQALMSLGKTISVSTT